MTAQDFLEWMRVCGFTRAADVSRSLGVARNYAQKWVRLAESGMPVEVSQTVALAMTARAKGLSAWAQKGE